MSRLTRDGTAEPVSRGDREIFIFPVQLTTSRMGNFTRLIHTLAIPGTWYVMCDVHTYTYTQFVYIYILLQPNERNTALVGWWS